MIIRRIIFCMICCAAVFLPRTVAAFELFGFTLFEGENRQEDTVELIDPHRFTVTAEIAAADDLRKDLLSASELWALRGQPASGAAGLISMARADYRRLLVTLYDHARYGATISILIDGKQAESLPLNTDLGSTSVVVIRIDPGPKFLFGTSKLINPPPGFDLGEQAPRDTFRRDFLPGAPARAQVITGLGEEGIEAWRIEGHAKAKIADREAIADHSTFRLDTSISFSPGPKTYYGPVTVTGQSRIDADFVRYMANIPQKGIFDPRREDRARKRLAAMNVFRSIQITEADQLAPDLTLPITIEVQDRPLRRFGFGATYSNFDGLGPEAFWLHRNLFGRAERLRFDAQIDGLFERANWQDYDYLFSVNLAKPGVFDPDNVLQTELRLDQTQFDDYRQRQIEARIGIDRNFRDELYGSLYFDVQFAHIDDDLGSRRFLTFSLPLEATYDQRDDQDDPTAGYFLTGQVVPFTEIRAGNTAIKTRLEARGYRGFGQERRTVIAARAAIGSLFGGNLLELPTNQLFFAGGGGSVRGYDFRSIGVPTGGGEIGGRSLLEGSVELRQRIGEDFGISAFLDAGTVSDQTFPFADLELQYGAGLGVRWYTGIGPIRLDVAAPLNPSAGDPDYAFYIGIGQAF